MDRQDCPALTTDPHKIAEVANSRSAEAKTMAGSLPPNSRKAGINCLAAASATFLPVATLPVKQTRSTDFINAAPRSPVPSTYAKISCSWGTKAIVFAKGRIKRGAISLGLTITAQPASNAGMVSIAESSRGKFQGLMTPTKG